MKTNPKAASKPKKNHSLQDDLSRLAKAIIASAGVGIYIVQHGKFVYVSELYQKLSGYTDTELLGTYSLNYIYSDDREMVREEAIKCLKGESFEPYEYRFVKKNDEVMWVLETITPILYKEERATLGSFMDITERKLMEKALRQSEERYRTILENMQEGYYEVDLTGNFTFCNDSLCRIHKRSKDEMMEINNRQYMDKETTNKVFEAFNRVYKTGEPLSEFNYQIIRKDGVKRYIEASVSLLKDSSGKPIGFRGITRDITERNKAEEALRESEALHREKEERYRNILDNMEEAYYEVDLKGNLTFFNAAAVTNLGYTDNVMMGMNFRQYMDEENAGKVFEAYNTVFLTGESIKGLDWELISKEGGKIPIESSISTMRDAQGNPIGFRGIIRDITDRKRADDALRESEQRYRELSIIDDLTQLYNSRHFYVQIEKEIERSNRYKQPLTLLMLDLDNFKVFNDTYGHIEGDNVLSRLGQVVKRCLRETDSAYRYGGEEFTIVLPMTTSKEGFVIAKRIQTELKKEAFSPVLGQEVYITVSIGLAQYKPKEDMKSCVNRIDQLMYQAKKEGRNQICPES